MKTRLTPGDWIRMVRGMPDSAVVSTAAKASPEIRLAELPALAGALADKVRAAGFQPEIILYVETGARLFANELAGILNVPLAPVWVKRGGHGMKKLLAPLVLRLPVGVRDGLRRLEERTGVQRVTRRAAVLAEGTILAGKRVLLVDDAADTGRTIRAARDLALAAGVREDGLRSAVIAATMAEGRASVNFYLRDRNHRMPWSADSEERAEAERRAEKLNHAHAPRHF